MILQVYDRDRKKLGKLNNAHNIKEVLKLNSLSQLFFSLPKADDKNKFCEAFNLVKLTGGQYYRIVKYQEISNDSGEVLQYECEHVLATLLNNLMYGFRVIGNLGVYTRDVINYVLDHQSDWMLDVCEFSRQFEYGWEQESLLSALYSIPNRMVEKYRFVTDTNRYPYRVSLVKIDETAPPKVRISRERNRISLSKEVDFRKIVTRLYPFGQGEGNNQITIEPITGGLPYIQSDQAHIDRYGLIELAWTDRRYTSAETLYEAAYANLMELQEPYIEYDVDFIGECEPGDIVEIIGETKTFVTEVTINYDTIITRSYKIANKPYDVAAALADLAERQRIEVTYAQGATQIYADSRAQNCSVQVPATLKFYIPDSMKFAHEMRCKIEVSRFRAESKSTDSGGQVSSTSSGGSDVTTSDTTTTPTQTSGTQPGENMTGDAGGGTYQNVTSGSSSTNTTSTSAAYSREDLTEMTSLTYVANATQSHRHYFGNTLVYPHYHDIAHTHISTVNIPTHTHVTRSSAHNHSVPGTSHNHRLVINAHVHSVDTRHSHGIEPTITFLGNATAFTLQVNGTNKAYFDTKTAEIDLTPYLLNNEKMLPRGTWVTIGVLPNDFAYADIAYHIEGFKLSRGGDKH